ncbi:MAG: hypothetical protein RL571_3419 [Pseudomonadota bacterium]
MKMSKALNFFAILLILGAICIPILSFINTQCVYLRCIDFKDAVLISATLLALAGHLFTQAKNLTNAEEKKSLFHLESFCKAFAYAQSLLIDKNNDRKKWIEAARSLELGNELAKNITIPSHLISTL